MKIIFTLLLVLSTAFAYAQELIFDKAGKVASAPNNCKETPKSKVDQLDTWSLEQQQKLQAELKQSFEATAKILRETTTPLGRYYHKLWTDSYNATKLADEYRDLAKNLPQPTLNTGSPLYSLSDILKTKYLDPKQPCYSFDNSHTSSIYRIKLIKSNITNDFLLAYYAKVAADPANQLFNELTPEAFEAIKARAVPQQRTLNIALAALRNSLNLNNLNQAYDAHQQFDVYQNQDLLFQLLRTPWVKSWIWRSNGFIKFNPLPFTDENIIYSKFLVDTAKARYFNAYVKKTVVTKLRDKKDLYITKYVSDLNAIGKSSILLTDSIAYKKALAANRAALSKTCITSSVVNDVIIPITKNNFHYTTYLSSQKDLLAASALPDIMSVDERVVFTVHNLAKEHSVKLVRTKATEVKDQSVTSQALDDAFTGIQSTSTVLGKLAIGAFMNAMPKAFANKNQFKLISAYVRNEELAQSIQHDKNKKIHFNDKSDEHAQMSKRELRDMLIKEYDTLFWSQTISVIRSSMKEASTKKIGPYRFINLLSSKDYLDDGILENIKKEFAKKVHKCSVDKVMADDPRVCSTLEQEVVNAYFTQYIKKIAAPVVYNFIRDDSLLLSTSITILNESDIPPRKVTPQNDEVALYHTDYAVTAQSDTTKAYTYVLQDEVNAKPTSFATYQYRTGKRYHIQFAAGITYTTQPVRNPELTTTNGQISYTTTDTRYRVYAGLHFYPWRIFLQDKYFLGTTKNWYTRLNILVGVGIPKPLDNFYLGAGYDFGPGIKLNAGVHLHGYTKYEVFNNQLINQAQVYEAVAPFFSIGIDPSTFVKAFTIFF